LAETGRDLRPGPGADRVGVRRARAHRVRAGRARGSHAVPVLLALCLAACVTVPATEPPPPRAEAAPSDDLRPPALSMDQVSIEPGPRTVEDALVLDLYTFFHAKDYASWRIEFPGIVPGETAVAHLLVPATEGPHPTVVVFPILAGSHVVSEALAKALVNRGFMVARLERRKMELEETTDTALPSKALRAALMDGRRLLDILETRDDVDPERIASAGVSVGGILACLLHGTDARVKAGIFIMPGGDVPEILADSRERPIRAFRNNVMSRESLDTEGFIERQRPLFENLDPIDYAGGIDPASVFFASSRFDRIIRPPHTEALWKALGEPSWTRMPIGHYQLLPLFWWVANRGADHLDRYFAGPETPAEQLADRVD